VGIVTRLAGQPPDGKHQGADGCDIAANDKQPAPPIKLSPSPYSPREDQQGASTEPPKDNRRLRDGEEEKANDANEDHSARPVKGRPASGASLPKAYRPTAEETQCLAGPQVGLRQVWRQRVAGVTR